MCEQIIPDHNIVILNNSRKWTKLFQKQYLWCNDGNVNGSNCNKVRWQPC